MKKGLFRFIGGMIILATLPLGAADYGMDQISRMIRSVPGLETSQQTALINAFDFEMGGMLFNRTIERPYLESIERIVNAGIFEEVEPKLVAATSKSVYEAELGGARADIVEDLALVGFTRPITGAQLGAAAKALDRLVNSSVDPVVYQDLLSYSLANAWSAEAIEGTVDGLIRGQRSGVDVGKLALAMIIRVDQGLGGRSIGQMVEEEIAFLRTTRPQSRDEKARRDRIYAMMQEAIGKGVPSDIAQEMYYESVEERWGEDVSDAVFEGLVQANGMGITLEKVALAMIIRVEQGLGDTSPEQMVREEIAWVAGKEQKIVNLVEEDDDLKTTSEPPPDPKQYQVHVDIPRRRDTTRESQPRVYNPSGRAALNAPLMRESINSYLGTPYRWGGNTRQGIDCSGFTKAVYKQSQGVEIPRVSRQQAQVGMTVSQRQLTYGDLVFFSKYGQGRITHVGIYVGNGQFAHSSCSKGVNITQLNKRYYQARWAGAKRVI